MSGNGTTASDQKADHGSLAVQVQVLREQLDALAATVVTRELLDRELARINQALVELREVVEA